MIANPPNKAINTQEILILTPHYELTSLQKERNQAVETTKLMIQIDASTNIACCLLGVHSYRFSF
jgi:hypothetical protein